MTSVMHESPISVPRDFNGYVSVARPSMRIRAAEVLAGDILVLDGYVSKVTGVRAVDFNCGRDFAVVYPGLDLAEVLDAARRVNQWPVLHIRGDVNIVRFPHELVSVIRP